MKAESPELEYVGSSPRSAKRKRQLQDVQARASGSARSVQTQDGYEQRGTKRRRKEASATQRQARQSQSGGSSRVIEASTPGSSTNHPQRSQATPRQTASTLASASDKPWSRHPHQCPEGEPCLEPIVSLPDELRRIAYHPTEDRYMNHYELLSEVVLDTRKLVMFAHETGLRYCGGRFNQTEEAAMEEVILTHCQQHSITRAQLCDLLQPTSPVPEAMAFLKTVCRRLPGRPFYVVHRHIKARLSDRELRGAWSEAEDRELLQLVKQHGAKAMHTFKIGARTGKDCSDRYHKCLRFPTKKAGRWTIDEEEGLMQVVKKAQYMKGGTGSTGKLKWEWVAKRVKDRTPKQCRDKWAKLALRQAPAA